MKARRWQLLLIALVAGCAAVPPGVPAVGSSGARLSIQPAGEPDEMPASLTVGVQVSERSIQTLPASWDTATLRLDHASALAAARVKTLAKGSGLVASGSAYVATSAFGGALRPVSGYLLTVSLWNGGANATLVGEKQVSVNLVAGPNAVSVPIEVYPALSLTGFSPATGSAGMAVTLSGQGFSVLPSQTQVSLGTAGDMQSVTPTSLSSTSIAATVPSSMGPGTKTWQVQVGSSLAARTGFIVAGILGSPFEASPAVSQQQDPAIAYGNGQYLAAWTDSRPASGAGLYGARITSGGTVGPDFLIASSAQPASRPAVAYDGASDRFLVVYESNNVILGQLVNADGTLDGTSFIIASAAGTRSDAKVAFDSTSNRYLVTWTDARTSPLQIYGQRVSATGGLVGGNFAIVTVAGVAQSRSQVAYSATANKFLVVNTSQSSPMRVVGRVVNPDGTFGSGVVTIGSGTGNQVDPAVAADPVSGDFLVVWDSAVTGFRDSILAQRVSSAGALVGGSMTVSAFNSTKEVPHLAYEPDRGTFLISWGDNRGSDTDLYAAHMALSGTLWGSEFPVASGPNGQSKGEVAIDAANRRGLVLYEETAGTNKKVFGQLIFH